jgi:hypothetical protein
MVGNLNFSAWFVKSLSDIWAWKGKIWNKNGILKKVNIMQRPLKHQYNSLLPKYINEFLGAFSYVLSQMKAQVAEILREIRKAHLGNTPIH